MVVLVLLRELVSAKPGGDDERSDIVVVSDWREKVGQGEVGMAIPFFLLLAQRVETGFYGGATLVSINNDVVPVTVRAGKKP